MTDPRRPAPEGAPSHGDGDDRTGWNPSVLLLIAGLDDELDPADSLRLQERLDDDPEFRRVWEHQRSLRQALRSDATYHAAPAELRARLVDAIRASPHAGAADVSPEGSPPPVRDVAPRVSQTRRLPQLSVLGWRRRDWMFGLAGAAMSAAATWLIVGPSLRIAPIGVDPDGDAVQAARAALDDAVAGHLRALMTDRLVDVASSDQHTVRPWLSAHLPFAPPAPDLSAQGFELIGARRDVLEGQVVAALVYRRRQHIITAYVRPALPAGSAEVLPATQHAVRGFNLIAGRRAGMAVTVVSDLNRRELADFAELVQAAL